MTADEPSLPLVARALSEIAQTLASGPDAQGRVARALELVGALIPNSRCALLDVSAREGDNFFVAPALAKAARKTLASRLRNLIRLLSPDRDEAPAEEKKTRAVEASPSQSHHLAVPVVALGRVGGLLYVEREAEPYDEQHLRLLSVVAAQLGAYLTTIRLREDELERARQLGMALRRLEETDRRKDEFLAMLGHELRNPLGAITTALQLLDERATDPKNRYHQVIDRQIKYLSHIVDDLLDASRVRLGKIQLDKRVVDLASIVRSWMDAFGETSLVRSHDVKLELSNEPIFVEGDVVRLEQIFSNVMTNALKYTPAGGSVRASIEKVEAHAVLRVLDSGIGMTSETLDRIFDLFVQADHSLARSHGGLGLGLPLVRSLIEMHGGSITATSPGLGRGSELIVSLPLVSKVDQPGATEARNAAPRSPGTAPLRIVIVEDNEDARDMLAAMLESWGDQVTTAGDGSAGLKRILAELPDVALVDIGLPGVDGYEIARAVRRELPPAQLALIAMTGYGQPEDRRRALDAGFDTHLVKPVSLDTLRRELDRIASAREREEL